MHLSGNDRNSIALPLADNMSRSPGDENHNVSLTVTDEMLVPRVQGHGLVSVFQSFGASRVLSVIKQISKGRQYNLRARRLLLRDAQIACLTACWTVILALPIVVWPVSDWLWSDDTKCNLYATTNDCRKVAGCSWRFQQHKARFECVGEVKGFLRGIQGLWGTMILQFVFSMYTSFGDTVKLTLQGFLGTTMATFNMILLNDLLGFWLGQGASGDRLTYKNASDAEITITNSRWLPLCNTGFEVLTASGVDELLGDSCFLNVYWSQVTISGLFKFSFVWLDFVLFVIGCLLFQFDNNTRMFALSTHVYFMMSFVDPSSTDYLERPCVSHNYFVMIAFASIVSILSFRLPRRRFTAADDARRLAEECTKAVALIIGSMDCLHNELLRHKTVSFLTETDTNLMDFKAKLEASWFEDFGFGSAARIRQSLRTLKACLSACTVHIRSVCHVASVLRTSDRQYLEERFEALGDACDAASDLILTASCEIPRGKFVAILWRKLVASLLVKVDFAALREQLSPEARAFLCTASFVIASTAEEMQAFAWEALQARSPRTCQQRVRGMWVTIRDHFGGSLLKIDRSVTHPRFVLRNTISISSAFFLGWVGVWNVLPAYTSYAASTITVVVYTYAGSSLTITIRRVAGVVLGKVIGTALQLALAVQIPWKACLLALSMVIVVGVTFFLYLHGDSEIGYVCCLTAGFAAASMIPSGGNMRGFSTETFSDVTPSLLSAIISTVIGVAILVIVDVLLASKASHIARQRLQLTFQKLSLRNLGWLDAGDGAERSQAYSQCFYDEVDKLQNVIPYAASEPQFHFGRTLFKADLYKKLEMHLRTIGSHMQTVAWVLGFHNLHDGTDCTDLVPMRELWRGLQLKLDGIRQLADKVTQDTNDHQAAEEMRERLREDLYSVMLLDHLRVGTGTAISRVTQRLLSPSRENGISETQREPTSVVSDNSGLVRRVIARASQSVGYEQVRSFVRQAVDENIVHEEAPRSRTTSHGSLRSSESPSFESIYGELRGQAMLTKATSPHIDKLGRVDLVIVLVQYVLVELQQMDLALLEY